MVINQGAVVLHPVNKALNDGLGRVWLRAGVYRRADSELRSRLWRQRWLELPGSGGAWLGGLVASGGCGDLALEKALYGGDEVGPGQLVLVDLIEVGALDDCVASRVQQLGHGGVRGQWMVGVAEQLVDAVAWKEQKLG